MAPQGGDSSEGKFQFLFLEMAGFQNSAGQFHIHTQGRVAELQCWIDPSCRASFLFLENDSPAQDQVFVGLTLLLPQLELTCSDDSS
jgi:hypothetical protein